MNMRNPPLQNRKLTSPQFFESKAVNKDTPYHPARPASSWYVIISTVHQLDSDMCVSRTNVGLKMEAYVQNAREDPMPCR